MIQTFSEIPTHFFFSFFFVLFSQFSLIVQGCAYVRRNYYISNLGGSSTASTKSATIEMYVGSSTGYNDTMSGETMSSISEKSGSYISEAGNAHDHHQHHHHHHHRHHVHHPQSHLMHNTAASAVVTTEFEVITLYCEHEAGLSTFDFSLLL